MHPISLTFRFARRAAIVLFAVTAPLALASTLPAYTMGSPEVVAMVQDGLKYLETTKRHDHVGGEALIAMTLTKSGYSLDHPRVAPAVKRCIEANPREDCNNYDLGITVVFLCDIGPQRYRRAIEGYLKEIYRRQDDNGYVWTYGSDYNGDTSQTQYGVLAMWTAMNSGFDVPIERVERACNWLIRTQSSNGAFGYQPNDPGKFDNRLVQKETRQSLTAAGLGCTYICADMLGLTSAPAQIQVRTELPPALVPVVDPVAPRKVLSRRVAPRYLTQAQIDGAKWFRQNFKLDETVHYPYYFLYALERYESFREVAEGRKDNSPTWYNDGVRFLMSVQEKNGCFRAKGQNCGEVINTAFAVLFLIRSTKKAIGAASEGRLRGGVGLPSNDSKMSLYGGRIVAADVSRSLSDLMNLLEDQESDELKDLIAFSPDAAFEVDDPAAYRSQMEQLRRLASHSKYEVRMVAVRALGQARDLDNVPALIYALSDPDPRVARAARDGLRFISRRFDGFGLSNFSDRGAVIQKWKQWYRSIRPDAPLLEGE